MLPPRNTLNKIHETEQPTKDKKLDGPNPSSMEQGFCSNCKAKLQTTNTAPDRKPLCGDCARKLMTKKNQSAPARLATKQGQ
jgi:predicted amidophosphoribosyltransferase